MPAILSKSTVLGNSGLTKGTPYDSGGVVINAKAGVGPIKQVDGTQQSATKLASDGTAGQPGNYLTGTAPSANSASVTNVAIASNVLTVTAANNFTVGQNVEFTRLTVATFLNTQNVVILTASGTQFTAAFTHADYGSAADSGGTATQTYATRGAGLSLYAGHE